MKLRWFHWHRWQYEDVPEDQQWLNSGYSNLLGPTKKRTCSKCGTIEALFHYPSNGRLCYAWYPFNLDNWLVKIAKLEADHLSLARSEMREMRDKSDRKSREDKTQEALYQFLVDQGYIKMG